MSRNKSQCFPRVVKLLSVILLQPAMLRRCKFLHSCATKHIPLSVILWHLATERLFSSRHRLAIDLIPLLLISWHFSTSSSFKRGQFLAITVSPRLETFVRPAMFSLCKRGQERATWPMASSVIGLQWSPDRSILWIPVEYEVTAFTVSFVIGWAVPQNLKSTSRQNKESLQRLFHRWQT